MKENYQKKLVKIIDEIKKKDNDVKPTLLLHTCCAPCSSYCLEYLSDFFDITVYYYNPNISEKAEFEMREKEQKRLIDELNKSSGNNEKIHFISGEYE